ncbi:MAG: GNAT family N-acetyltransferase [Selenomonadaceae bacterium]|nr:GNAT family N-acetyltransferase [Selenomonadaceae bacterium]
MIRSMKEQDREVVIDMMYQFYNSPAVITNGSEEIFNNNFDACINEWPTVRGYVLIDECDVVGYAITAKSYSTEFGRECIWIEDLYIQKEYRGRGLGTEFIQYLRSLYSSYVLRLEAEVYNSRALETYKKNGFMELPYAEMIALPKR